jgi:hypothetical protein
MASWSVATRVVPNVGWAVSFPHSSASRVRSAEASPSAFVENLHAERATQGHVLLIQLNRDTKPLPANLAGAMIPVHGLMSTDLGTFDGFLNSWAKPTPTMCPPVLFAQRSELMTTCPG